MTVRSRQSDRFDTGPGLRWTAAQDAALDDVIGRASDGIPTVLLIKGGPGSGKTTLLRRVAAAAAGFHLLQLHGDGGDRPYGALLEQQILTHADPGLGPVQAATTLRRRIDETRAGAPVLVLLDDLDRLDSETVQTVARLVERTYRDRLLIAAAADPLNQQALESWSRIMIDSDRALTVELAGLTESDAVHLVTRAWPDADSAIGHRLWIHTAGNPLFLQTLLHEHTLDEVRDADELPAPDDLVRTFADRLERLDADGSRLLRAVVMLEDRWTPLATAAAVAGLADAAVAEPVAGRLAAEGLLRTRESLDRYQVRLDSSVARKAIADAIPVSERRAVHTRAAELVDSPVDALWHRFSAAIGYDDRLADDLADQAWQLHLAREFRQACRVGLWSSAATADPVLRERRLLDALFDGTLARDLDAVGRRLGDRGAVRDQARSRLVEGFVLLSRRRWAQASTVFSSIPARAVEATDARTRYRLYVLRAWARMVTGGSSEQARRELDLADAESTVEPCLSGYVGFASALSTDIRATDTPIRPAGGLELDDAWQGAAAAVAGLPDLAVRHLRPFVAKVDDGLLTIGDGEFHALLGYAYWLRGEWSPARDLIRTSLEAQHLAAHPMVRSLALVADLASGNPEALDHHRDQAREALCDAPWPSAISVAASTEFLCLRLTGRQQDQQRYLTELNADFPTIAWPGATPPFWLLSYGMINAAAGKGPVVGECADALAGQPQIGGWHQGAVDWLRGLAAELDGDHAAAVRCLDRAHTRGMAELRVHSALLAADLARVRRSVGDQPAAISARREFDDRLAAIDGADYLIAPSADPLAPLTDREREVVDLLGQGLSYAQIARELFLSRSTVAFHLSNIYAKTATGSRHELIALVRRR